MDTSKEYVEMCRQANEIQVTNICHAMLPRGQIGIRGNGDYYAEFAGKTVWLPRQDQLQAISLKKGRALAILLSVCLEIDYSNHREYFTESKFESMEQFWLAYVMYWNFKKLWDDTKNEWVTA